MRLPVLLSLLLLAAQEKSGPPSLFDDSRIHTIHVVLQGDDYARLHQKPFQWFKGDVEIDGELVRNVAVREKGNSSSGIRSDKKPLKIDFAEHEKDRSFRGARMLVLNNGFKDPSLLREKLAYDLFRAAGCPAPRAAHAMVHLTARGRFEKQYFGLYTMVEHVDEAFLDERFGGHEGNLYKPEGFQDLFSRPDERMIYDEKAVELKTNEKKNDRSRLVKFVQAVAEGRDIDKWLDVESFLKWLAVNTALVNLDSYAGTGHNYYLYDDPKTGRFVLIPWDLNEAFGNFQMGPPESHLDWDIHRPHAGPKALIEKVLAVKAHKDRYLQFLRELCTKDFTARALFPRIDALARGTADAAAKDTKKEWPTADWTRSISEDLPGMGPKTGLVFGLKPFVERRAASILDQLAGRRKGKTLEGKGPGGPPGKGPPPPPPR